MALVLIHFNHKTNAQYVYKQINVMKFVSKMEESFEKLNHIIIMWQYTQSY